MRCSKLEATGLVVLFLLSVFCFPGKVEGKGFLRTRGQDIVDESGEKVMLRGVGLGNWLLPEGLSFHCSFSANADEYFPSFPWIQSLRHYASSYLSN